MSNSEAIAQGGQPPAGEGFIPELASLLEEDGKKELQPGKVYGTAYKFPGGIEVPLNIYVSPDTDCGEFPLDFEAWPLANNNNVLI
jgi:hypothetical protein